MPTDGPSFGDVDEFLHYVCYCGRRLRTLRANLSKQGRCPTCGATVRFTSDPEQPASHAPALEPEAETLPEESHFNDRYEAIPALPKHIRTALIWAFISIPIFAVIMIALTIQLFMALNTYNAGVLRLGFTFVVICVGIAAAALRCIRWLYSDPFKAVAIGRKLFLVYLVCSVVALLIMAVMETEAAVVIPASAILHQEYVDTQAGVICQMMFDASGASERGGAPEAAGFLFEAVRDIWEEIAILLFLTPIYLKLRGDRRDFTWKHFWNLVSFGMLNRQHAYEWKTDKYQS